MHQMKSQIMQSVFGKEKALIGMIHVRALPGSPKGDLSVEQIVEIAVKEGRLYEKAGFDAIMIENMHDRPYVLGTADATTISAMTIVGYEVRRSVHLPLGVQILTGANREAVAVAHMTGAAFVRVESFVFAHVAHSGFLNACAGTLVRYRDSIGAKGVYIFADIKKKHAAHSITEDVSIVREATTAERFLADGVILSGLETAQPADPEAVRQVSAAVKIPVLVGSGITADNLRDYVPAADALIVGSSVKQGGLWSNPIDEEAVRRLASVFKQALR